MGFTLDREIKRALGNDFNYTEPPVLGKIIRLKNNLADIQVRDNNDEYVISEAKITYPLRAADSPVKKGDYVVVIFINGLLTNAAVISKW